MPILPPTPLSTRHKLYIGVLQCAGSSALDAGIMFGLHVLIFMNQTVQLWPLPTTIAGDMFVSLLITSILTWVIAGAMVWGDVSKGSAGPLKLAPLALESVARLAAQGGWKGWITTVSSVFDADGWACAGVATGLERTGTVRNRVGGGGDAVGTVKPHRWFHAVGANAARGAVFAILLFVVVWPISVGICAGVWGNDNYTNYPQAPGIFAVYGAVLGATKSRPSSQALALLQRM